MSSIYSILEGLSLFDHPKINEVIYQQFAVIKNNLLSSNKLDVLKENLQELQIISHRVPSYTVDLIKEFLEKIKSLDIMYDNEMGFDDSIIKEMTKKSHLIIKSLEILEQIRYYQISSILKIFVQYFSDKDKDVSNKAQHGLTSLASYDIEAVKALGIKPQEEISEEIEKLSVNEKIQDFTALTLVCKAMLSPLMETSSWNHDSVTFIKGSIFDVTDIGVLRKKVLLILKNLYPLARNDSERLSVLHAMYEATKFHKKEEKSTQGDQIVLDNTSLVLHFFHEVITISTASFPVLLEIERESSRMSWINDELKGTVSDIKALIYQNKEYQIFRDLIGSEIFVPVWEREGDFEKQKLIMEQKAIEYAREINEDNFSLWQERIISFSNPENRTFSNTHYLYKFLECFGKESPLLVLRLLNESARNIEDFIICLLLGVLRSDSKQDAISLMGTWVDAGVNLQTCAQVFEHSEEFDEQLMKKILSKAQEPPKLQPNVLIQIIITVIARYEDIQRNVIQDLTLPAINILTEQRNTNWIYKWWYPKKFNSLISSLSQEEIDTVLDNLIYTNTVDFRLEEILSPIAERYPTKVVNFFKRRIAFKEIKETDERYDAVPFNFYSLHTIFSKFSKEAIDPIREDFDPNDRLFTYQGASLLQALFPDFPKPFEEELLQLVLTGEERNIMFVMRVLRNYEGNMVIHDVCRAIVNALPNGSEHMEEVATIMESTGGVMGEFGFVEAYEDKKKEVESWLSDENEKIRAFAQYYMERLESQIQSHKKRAEEDIELRKHRYE